VSEPPAWRQGRYDDPDHRYSGSSIFIGPPSEWGRSFDLLITRRLDGKQPCPEREVVQVIERIEGAGRLPTLKLRRGRLGTTPRSDITAGWKILRVGNAEHESITTKTLTQVPEQRARPARADCQARPDPKV
jgi:hypothetical protein